MNEHIFNANSSFLKIVHSDISITVLQFFVVLFKSSLSTDLILSPEIS